MSVPQWLILTLTVHINVQRLVRPLSNTISSRRVICHCAVQVNSSWECRQGVALLYRCGRRREGPRGSPVRRGLWPTTQYITADENELVTALNTSFNAVPAKWIPCSTRILPRTTQHHAEGVMDNTEKRHNVPDCWQTAALSKFELTAEGTSHSISPKMLQSLNCLRRIEGDLHSMQAV